MNKLTKAITDLYVPEQAIIIYNNNKEYYLESHRIAGGKLMEGKPLTHQAINSMVEFFKTREEDRLSISGTIPECLLVCQFNAERKLLVWYRKSEKRPMYFTKDLKIPNGTAMQPALLFVMQDDELKVHALGSSDRPTEKTQLFIPPYHNTSALGDVCLGSAEIENARLKTYTDYIEYWEKLFWGSKFSHLAGEVSPIKGNVNSYWKNAIQTKSLFNNEVLKKLNGKTFGRLMEELGI